MEFSYRKSDVKSGRTYGVSRLVLAALAGASAVAVPAGSGFAATKTVNAQSSWAISRVASMTQGSYCTMAQKYDDNSILSFARSADGEYSMAIDFQSAQMKDGQEENFVLQAGQSAEQSYKVMPQSDHVAVIGLGKDDDFFKAIESADGLSVTYSGGSTSYRLAKFEGGRSDLMTCVSGLGKAEVAPVAEMTGSESADVTSVAPASGTNEPSVEGLLAAKPMPSAGAESVSRMDVPVQASAADVPALEVIYTKEADATGAVTPDENMAKISDDPKVVRDLMAENAELKHALSQSRQDYENKLVQAQGQSAADGETAKELAIVQTENTQLKTRMTEMEQQIKAAQTSIMQAQSKSDDDSDKLYEQLRALRAEYDNLEKEKAALQTRYEALQKETETGQIKNAGGNWDLEQATRRYQESQREIRRLGALLDDERLKCTAEKKQIEGMLFDPKIADSAQITKLNELQDQVIERDAKIKELQAQLTGGVPVAVSAADSAGAAVSPEQDRQIEMLKQTLAETEKSLNEAIVSREKAEQNLAAMQKVQPSAQENVSAVQASSVQPAYGVEGQSSAAAPVSAATLFPSLQDYSSFLKEAGVPVEGALSEVKSSNSSAYKAYRWKTKSLYGSVEMRAAAAPQAFDQIVSQYMSRAKSRCKGDFAAVPAPVTVGSAEKSSSYEIACVGQNSSSSASVLFTYGKGIISTIAHEGRAEAMDLAIDARDKVAKSVY